VAHSCSPFAETSLRYEPTEEKATPTPGTEARPVIEAEDHRVHRTAPELAFRAKRADAVVAEAEEATKTVKLS
jgi:hypothetical protein